MRVRYLHSDIDTVERVEIIRDLRIGEFDVLVGINLLREGLDIPEVSLVAILDADKEGFLRSDRSLIQTMGRAARNLNGKAILYGDRMTGSMERSIAETNRRREKQLAFNQEHGIVPQGIEKSVEDILEGAYTPGARGRSMQRKAAEPKGEYATDYDTMSPQQLGKQIKQLETEMYKAAQDLNFEEAARLRDKIAEVNQFLMK